MLRAERMLGVEAGERLPDPAVKPETPRPLAVHLPAKNEEGLERGYKEGDKEYGCVIAAPSSTRPRRSVKP